MKFLNDSNKRQSGFIKDNTKDTRKDVLFYNDILKNARDRNLLVYARKVEKIVTALFLVTEVMDEAIPLTNSLRAEALELLNGFYTVLTTSQKIELTHLTRLLIRLEHVTSLITVGKISHQISDMNAEVLSAELQKVIELMGNDVSEMGTKQQSYSYHSSVLGTREQPVLSHALFDEKAFEELEKSKRHQNDIKTTSATQGVSLRDFSQNKKDVIKSIDTIKTTSIVSSGSDDRKSSIINVVRSHKDASMQDIQKYVTGCSGKTLQREIAQLIDAGVIKKTGDKRWATYQLIER